MWELHIWNQSPISFAIKASIQSRQSSLVYFKIHFKFFQENVKNCPEVNSLRKTTTTDLRVRRNLYLLYANFLL